MFSFPIHIDTMHLMLIKTSFILKTEIEGIRNPHGLGKGWSWLARFLNALPANKSTAYALEAFLKVSRLHINFY